MQALEWQARLRLFGPLMLWQLLRLSVLSALLVVLLLGFFLGLQDGIDALRPVGLIGAVAAVSLFVLCLLAVLLLGGSIDMMFRLDRRGAATAVVDRRARGYAWAALVLGAATGKAAAAGSGLLALTSSDRAIDWDEVASVRGHRRSGTIALCNSWRTVLLLAVPPSRFDEVMAFIERARAAKPAAAARNPLLRLLLLSLSLFAAVAPVMLLPWPFELDLFWPLLTFCFAQATLWLVPLFGWVVIAGTALIVVELLTLGLEPHASQFGGEPWRPLLSLDTGEAAALAVAALGLAWLVVFSLLALRGRIRPALFSP
jgi:hypothetical protein